MFTGANDAEPINAGFRRDRVVFHDAGCQLVNGVDPYRDHIHHVVKRTYYVDERDRTGTAETITLRRRGDVFQIYAASGGSSFSPRPGSVPTAPCIRTSTARWR